jgi:hypothetical protein
MKLKPFFSSSRDGFVHRERFSTCGDDVQIQDSCGVAGPDNSAGIMSVLHFLQDNSEIGLPEGKNSFDFLSSFFCGHRKNITKPLLK